jgi:hypothetical protein
MFGFDYLHISVAAFVFDIPLAGQIVVRTARRSAAHLQFAAQRRHLFGTRFPHHSRPSSRITERIDQRLDHFAPVAVVMLRDKRVLDGAA